jgi:hypothetical protein
MPTLGVQRAKPGNAKAKPMPNLVRKLAMKLFVLPWPLEIKVLN